MSAQPPIKLDTVKEVEFDFQHQHFSFTLAQGSFFLPKIRVKNDRGTLFVLCDNKVNKKTTYHFYLLKKIEQQDKVFSTKGDCTTVKSTIYQPLNEVDLQDYCYLDSCDYLGITHHLFIQKTKPPI